MNINFKDFLRDKWVCDAKTKRLIADPWFNFGIRYIAECELSGSNGQAHNLKFWTVSWTPSRVRLPVEPALFALSKTSREKELEEASRKW